jgi:signal transduction histidine kinase
VAILLVLLLGGTTYGVLYIYFQNATDLALRTKMASVFNSLGVSLPASLSQAEQQWSEKASHSLNPFKLEENESKEEEFEPSEVSSAKYEGELSSIFVMPLDVEGNLIFNPNPFDPPMLPDRNAVKAAAVNENDLRTVSLADGTSVRLLTYKLLEQTGVEILQLGKPIEDQLKILNQFLEGLLIIGSASIIVLGFGSWWLAGRMLASAQKAWDSQQEFVANASHELRAPLTLIRAGSDAALRKSTRNSSVKNLLGDVVSEVDHMNHLVEDLLLMSRLDIGKLKMVNEVVPLEELAGEIERQYIPIMAEKLIDFTVQSEPLKLFGDKVRLRQVILILLDNALRHTPVKGNILLTFKEQDNHTVISVSDSGEGIPAKHLPHVFERFYQAESDRRDGNTGSGLGLSIAKSIVEAHGGKISIQSEMKVGTTVICSFPFSAGLIRKQEKTNS